jgi:hypothetical protein
LGLQECERAAAPAVGPRVERRQQRPVFLGRQLAVDEPVEQGVVAFRLQKTLVHKGN